MSKSVVNRHARLPYVAPAQPNSADDDFRTTFLSLVWGSPQYVQHAVDRCVEYDTTKLNDEGQ